MSIVRFLLLNYSFPLFDLLCHEFGCMHIIYYMLRLTTYIAYANGSAARSDTCIFLTFSPVCRRLPFFPYFRYQFAKIIFRFTFSHSLLSIFFLILGLCVCARAFFPVSYHATFLCSIMFSSQYCKFILICSYCFATYVHLRYCCYYCGCRLTFVLGAKVASFNLDKNHICRSIVCFACFECLKWAKWIDRFSAIQWIPKTVTSVIHFGISKHQ